MAKTTMANYRKFIIARFNDEQMPITGAGPGQLPGRKANATNGTPIPGDAYQRASGIIGGVADKVIRAELLGQMRICSKFQFLQMITEPNHLLMQHQPDVALAIVESIAGEEYARDESLHGGMHAF